MKLQYLTKKDYLAKRLDINIYNSFVKQYNSTEDLNYSTKSYLYFAFGQSLVGSNNVPNTAW